MAKKKSVKGGATVLAALRKLMKDLDQKYSIRVGIIGSQAYEKSGHSDLTNAQLGAVHEFGATINVTDKMRAWLHYHDIHLKPETTTITIPARSFLRDTFLNDEAKERLADFAMLGSDEFNEAFYKLKLAQDPKFLEAVCKAIGLKALEMVNDSFNAGGYPTKWSPITEYTKKHRIGDPNNPPLDDTGALRDSISVDVHKVK